MHNTDIFQQCMKLLLDDTEDIIRVYIDDMLGMIRGEFKNPIENIDIILLNMGKSGMQVN